MKQFKDLVWSDRSFNWEHKDFKVFSLRNAQVTYGEYVLSISTGTMLNNGDHDLYEILVRKNGKDFPIRGITRDDAVRDRLSADDVSIIMSKMFKL